MTENQRQRLKDHKSKFLNIGVTKNGEGYDIIGVPWEKTVNAFNMHTPDVYLSSDDLKNEELMNELIEYEVLGFYSWVPLDDYSFLSRFTFLRDISIMHAEGLSSLDFMRELYDCRMLYIEDAKLENIDVLIDLNKRGKGILTSLMCVGLLNCEVEDVSAFEKERTDFSEFLVWEYEGKNEKEKWKHVGAITFRYYEIKRQ